MSLNLKNKRSAVAGSTPTPAQLEEGEIGVNYNSTDPALYIKDSTGTVVRIAGDGAVGGGGEWTRTGTTLSPNTAGDDVFTSGDVRVGGTTGSPNINLDASGAGTFEGSVHSSGIFDGYRKVTNPNGALLRLKSDNADTSAAGSDKFFVFSNGDIQNPNISLKGDGSSQFAGDMKIGGTLPASPNISLNANGSATFASSVDSGSLDISSASGAGAKFSPAGVLYLQRPSGDAVSIWQGTSQNVTINSNGSATFAGNGTFASVITSAQSQFSSADFGPAMTLGSWTGGNASANALVIKNQANSADTVVLHRNGSSQFAGDMKIGGTLPASPNIELKADGSGTFGVNTGTYQTGVNIAHDVSDNTTLTVYSKGSSTVNSFAVYDNSESGANKYRATIKQDGSAEFAGNVAIGDETGINVQLNVEETTGTKPVSRFHADNAASDLIQGVKQSTAVFRVANNGNVTNTNNSYGAISDIKLKENIVDANSQWDDLKALQVRHYNFKPETGYSNHTQIGLVAQEAELVSPGLVSESPDLDEEGNDLGTVTKSVNYSVLYMKAVKALQEAMERIETLEAEVAALKGA